MMWMEKFTWVSLTMLLATVTPVLAESLSPFNVGCKAQLFVDQVLVRSAENVSFTLHPATKHPKNPLLRAELPWEGWRLALCGSALYDADEKLFKMWYLGLVNGSLYATSQDGIAWEKPLVGTYSLIGWEKQKHNAVIPDCYFASVFKDPDDPDPSRQFKIIGWAKNPPGVVTDSGWGYHTMVSPDGLHWKLFSKEPICPGGDDITGYYDRERHLYVAFPKTMTLLSGFNQRCFSVITSQDFVHWTEPKLVFVPDERDNAGSLARIEEVRPILDVPDDPRRMRTEFYGIGVYQHQSCTIAFPWMLTINNNARYGNHEGPGEIQLAVSRDLEHWERPFRLPCIPRGKVGEWDCGFFWTPSEAFRVGDEIRLYYAAGNYTHGTPVDYREDAPGRGTKYTASIGLATWKLDRFVSVDGPAEGGTLTTVPIVFSGDRLEINAATRPGGSVVVELFDVSGKTLARSKPFAGDALRHVVAWNQKIRLAELAGKPVFLRFHLKRAQLYSFAFRETISQTHEVSE